MGLISRVSSRTYRFFSKLKMLRIANITRMAMSSKANPIVFFDTQIGGEDAGRIIFELNADVLPKTSDNFALVTKSVLTKVQSSIELFQTSCFKVVTSPTSMELADDLFMATNSEMKTSNLPTANQVC